MTKPILLKQYLRDITTRLTSSSDTPQLDAELLCMHVLKKHRAFLYAYGDKCLTHLEINQLERLVKKRIEGVPIAYLMGRREFYSREFEVNEATLIPRPETELLVSTALELLKSSKVLNVLELGVGSGAIAITLAKEKPHWHILAVDQCKQALAIAEKNRDAHAAKNVALIHSNWFDAVLEKSFDLIISNPPYLAESDPHQHQGDVKFEPKNALLSGVAGLDDLKHIIQTAPDYLAPGGLLLLEHGYTQGEAVRLLLLQAGYQNAQTWKDINQLDRVTGGFKLSN